MSCFFQTTTATPAMTPNKAKYGAAIASVLTGSTKPPTGARSFPRITNRKVYTVSVSEIDSITETSSTTVSPIVVVLVEAVVEVDNEVTVLVPTLLELDMAVWTVVVLVAPTIVLLSVVTVMLAVDDTVVLP